MGHDVFISYSTQDQVVADAACTRLEARNLRCWIAPRDLSHGVNWGEAIKGAIGGAKVMVLIFSDNANTSRQVLREVTYAHDMGVDILPFRCEDATPVESLERFLADKRWLDALAPPFEQHLERLSEAVCALIGREPREPSRTPAANSAFISYRREGGAETARLVQAELLRRGINVFLDVDDMGSSYFDERLLLEIERAPNFIVILSRGSLERCAHEGDWLRREIAHAIQTRRNIIPLMKDGFSFSFRESLPGDINALRRHNGVGYSHEFFDACIEKLVGFLRETDDEEAQPERITPAVPPGDLAESLEILRGPGDPHEAETKEAETLIAQGLPRDDREPADSVILPGDVAMEFVRISPGTFLMGSPASEAGRQRTEQQHEVTLTQEFRLSKYPVTQAQWQAVMDNNPSKFQGDDQRPVEQVSWIHCLQFILKLNATGAGLFRLPTEAEWEYACRAGTSTAFFFGDDEARLVEYGWYEANSGQQTHPVGQRPPNPWGLHDMHGNVFEWCQDRFGNLPDDAETDPTGAASGNGRLVRGGSWALNAIASRSAYRARFTPGWWRDDFGFRLARTV